MVPYTSSTIRCCDAFHQTSSVPCHRQDNVVIHRMGSDSASMIHKGKEIPERGFTFLSPESLTEIGRVINQWEAEQTMQENEKRNNEQRERETKRRSEKQEEDMIAALGKYAKDHPSLINKPAETKQAKAEAPPPEPAKHKDPTTKIREIIAQAVQAKDAQRSEMIEVSKNPAPRLHFTSSISSNKTLEEEQAKADKFLKEVQSVRSVESTPIAKARGEVLKAKLGELTVAPVPKPSNQTKEEKMAAWQSWCKTMESATKDPVRAGEPTPVRANGQAAPQQKVEPVEIMGEVKTEVKQAKKPIVSTDIALI